MMVPAYMFSLENFQDPGSCPGNVITRNVDTRKFLALQKLEVTILFFVEIKKL